MEALQLLGDHYTERGLFDNSLKVDQQLSCLQPANPLVFYNLACSYSLNGQVAMAANALEHAIALGYRDFSWLARDPDLQLRRHDPAYRTSKSKIKQIKNIT
ncbi:hypothetical protein EG829_28080 [bacterium]|nr:hypothetical protein [bacterium]